MNILVTGGAGFIGRRVAKRLQALGHTFKVVDSYEPRVHGPSAPAGIHVGTLQPAELRGFDSVIHLAAQVGVADSQTDWWRYIHQNTIETAQFLEMLTWEKPARLIVASSMSVYGDPQTREPVDERHPVEPASIYGLTKYDQERLCRIWGKQHNVTTVALRFFNVYGPGQALTNPYTGVLANFAQRLLAGLPPTIYEDGLQTRDFIYVDDVVERVVTQATGSGPSDTYNICTGAATTILDAARLLAKNLGVAFEPDVTGRVRSGDIRHCVGSPTKYNAAFKPPAPISFAAGLERYVRALK